MLAIYFAKIAIFIFGIKSEIEIYVPFVKIYSKNFVILYYYATP